MNKSGYATTRVISRLTIVLSSLIAFAFPAIFLALEYRSHVASMEMEAHFSAVLVSELININPDLWQFEEHRLEELIKKHKDEGLPEVHRVLGAKGQVIVQNLEQLDAPTISRFAMLLDSGIIVGRLEVIRSLRPLLFQTALVGILGFLMGLAMFVVLRIYPLQALNHALETLTNEKKRAELILNSIDDGVITIDSRGTVLSFNPAAQKIFGYAVEQVVGHNLKMLMPEADRSAHHDYLHGYVTTGKAKILGTGREVTALRNDGSMFQIEFRVSEFYLDEERRFLGSVRDITERLRVREEVTRLNASLEERVQQRTAQLQAANEELQAFAYSVSHDLRTPLSSIAGFSGLIGRELAASAASERTRHYLDRIGAGVVHMSQLIDTLLSLAQISRTQLSLHSVDLSAMAQKVLSVYQELEPGRSVLLDIQPGLIVQGDPKLLHQVLENLFGNAWKFCSQGPQTRIAFRCERSLDGGAVYAVQDNGAGFDMAYSDKLFGAFQRLHAVEEFPGTGIGLATVQRIIGRHGGRVWAISSPGHGATFYFTLGTSTP